MFYSKRLWQRRLRDGAKAAKEAASVAGMLTGWTSFRKPVTVPFPVVKPQREPH